MYLLRVGRPILRRPCTPITRAVHSPRQFLGACSLITQCQTRARHSYNQRPVPQTGGRHRTIQQPNAQAPENAQNPNHKGTEYAVFPESEYEGEEEFNLPRGKVRYLRPAIWALSVSSGIYVFLAYLQAREETRPRTAQQYLPQWNMQRRAPPTPTEVATRAWDDLSPIAKVSAGIIGTNGVVHLTSFLVPNFWMSLWHLPARNVNYTLLTSTFVHSGPLHFLFNMWACYNFMMPVGYSKLFEASPYHTLSFFLSTGLLSSFAQHWSTMFHPGRRIMPDIFIRSGGASGALFAVFGAFCMQYPTAGVGIMFIPYYIDAQYFLPVIMAFDLIGMVRGYRFVNFGHAAHLSGALIGIAYSTLDGNNNLWKPLVRFWKGRLQKQHRR